MTGKRSSERTCIACRARRSREELLVLRAPGGVPIFAAAREGRGAFVCISRDCLNNLGPRALSRAFKRQIKMPAGCPSLLVAAHTVAQRRVLECLGLARRLGLLVVGIDRAWDGPEAGSVTVAATDLSPRTQRRAGDGELFLTSEEIGRAVGMGRVGAARITGGRLAGQARYWLSVWRETRPSPLAPPAGGSVPEPNRANASHAPGMISSREASKPVSRCRRNGHHESAASCQWDSERFCENPWRGTAALGKWPSRARSACRSFVR